MVKNLPANAGDPGLIPGSGRSPAEGNGNPLQYSCLGNPMDKGAWWATGHGVTERQTRLSDKTNKQTISSGVHQSDSVIHIHIFILFSYRLSQNID